MSYLSTILTVTTIATVTSYKIPEDEVYSVSVPLFYITSELFSPFTVFNGDEYSLNSLLVLLIPTLGPKRTLQVTGRLNITGSRQVKTQKSIVLDTGVSFLSLLFVTMSQL